MIINTEQKGRCVFADHDYKKDAVIEVCEFIHIPHEQIDILTKTVMNDYWFGMNGADGDAMILLGNGSLYNHSTKPNMVATYDSKGNFGFVALHDIAMGEELVFDYGYTPNFVPVSNLKVIVGK